MVTHRWSGRFRAFWNSAKEGPLCWSLDQGDVSTEVKVSSLTLQAPVRTRENLAADNVHEPHGWLEGVGEVRIYDNGAALVMGPGLVIHTQAFDRLTDEKVN